MARDFKLLHETIERDSEKRLFLMLSYEEAEQYRNPTVGFLKSIAAFPSTEHDIRDARQRYVLGQDTACVFHGMGILQRGLFALADDLDVKFRGSIELENWEQYDAITRKRFTLPDEIQVFPAHDYRGYFCSTIGEEKRFNARIAGRSRDAYIALMSNLGMPLPEKIQEALQVNESAIR